MLRQAIWVSSLAICAVLSAHQAAGGESVRHLEMPPDFAAALFVAYDDYKLATKSDSAPFGPREVLKLESVTLRKEDGTVVVRFQPPRRENATGGSIIYVIDPSTLDVVRRIFGR